MTAIRTLLSGYFPELTEDQLLKYERMGELYQEWNQKINVISRKDMDQIGVHHILHSLGIASPIEGLFYLKGGDLEEEIAESGLITKQVNLSDYFTEEFFETKKVVYVPLK